MVECILYRDEATNHGIDYVPQFSVLANQPTVHSGGVALGGSVMQGYMGLPCIFFRY